MDPTGPSTGIPATDPGPGGIGTYPHGHWVSDSAGVKADSHLVQEADRSHLGTSSTQWERWQGWPHANTISRVRHDNVSANTHQWVTYRHDPCGNITFDGEYFYQYDAWNRLVQVNAAGEMIWQLFVAAGVPRPVACEDDLLLGGLVKHFVYDGVGRLIRTSSPLEAPDGFDFSYTDGNGTHYVNAINRSERFFYDGTRRIQELITDPVLVTDEEHDTISMSDEVYQSQSGGSVTLSGMYVRAQYIWGPGDGTNGADELLCQLDPRDTSSSSYTSGGGKPWYVLTDAQGDVVSIAHLPVGSNQVVEVGGQWTYSPYGEVLTYEKLHPHPAVVFGHKTLPVDRLDAPALGWDTEGEGYSAETRRLIPGATLVGYARNRSLRFDLGRWMQGDPNASGLSVMPLSVYHGTSPSLPSILLALESRLSDGANLLAYAVSNPITHSDPNGLYSKDEFVEDFYDSNFSLPGPQDFLIGALSSMVGTYAANQEWDADWASDWTQGDDWHTRGENSWVGQSMVQGIYDSFEMGWGDYKVNPLNIVLGSGSGNPANSPGSANVNGKNLQDHHIASNKGSYRQDFEIEFKRAGMSLDDPENIVKIPHGGRHSREYHEYVLKRVKSAVQTKSPDAAKAALKAELKSLKDFIRRNPHFAYNSAGGKQTGWKGMREHYTTKSGNRHRYKGPR